MSIALCFKMNFHAKVIAQEQKNWVNLQHCFEGLLDVKTGFVMARWKALEVYFLEILLFL